MSSLPVRTSANELEKPGVLIWGLQVHCSQWEHSHTESVRVKCLGEKENWICIHFLVWFRSLNNPSLDPFENPRQSYHCLCPACLHLSMSVLFPLFSSYDLQRSYVFLCLCQLSVSQTRLCGRGDRNVFFSLACPALGTAGLTVSAHESAVKG